MLRTAGSIIEKSRDSLRNLPREGVSSNLGRRSANGRLKTLLAKEREGAVTFPSAGRWPPWSTPTARRSSAVLAFFTIVRLATGTNQTRRTTRTQLRDLGRLQLIEDGLRLGKAVAPLLAHWSFANT
jgi:hypothetical protein